MSRRDQPDLFGHGEPDLSGADPGPVVHRADPDKIRARLGHILAEARAARTLPWNRAETRLYATIVPQMTRWLPEEEAARWQFEFSAELERLEAA